METVRVKRKKAGRPAKDIKKEIRACVRITRAEYFFIREQAAKAGMKLSAYLREAIFEDKVIARLTEEERQVVRQLIGMANNINQIAKVCHQEGLLSALWQFESYRNHIDELLKKLRS